jgi:DNA-binding CsgD family transcriptional regulator
VTRAKRARATKPGAAVTLTDKKRRILLLMFAGCRVREIAVVSGRSQSTIANTIQAVRKQLNVRTDVDLFRECLARRLVTLKEVLALANEVRRAHDASLANRERETQPDTSERE